VTVGASPSSIIAGEIERYLRTGEADMMGNAWPGDIMERGRRQHADLRGALVEEVRRLAKGRGGRTRRCPTTWASSSRARR